VGCQHNGSAALPAGKTLYPLYRRLGGPQGRSGRVRKISPHRNSILGPSSPYPVAIPTELPGPHLSGGINENHEWFSQHNCYSTDVLTDIYPQNRGITVFVNWAAWNSVDLTEQTSVVVMMQVFMLGVRFQSSSELRPHWLVFPRYPVY
jgi:hypothetical protein